MKFVNFATGNTCHRVRSMKKEYENFHFAHNIVLKQNYIYTIIFGEHLSELHWILFMCF